MFHGRLSIIADKILEGDSSLKTEHIGSGFGLILALQFSWILPFLFAAVNHASSDAVRRSFNLIPVFMIVSGIAALIWLLKIGPASGAQRAWIIAGIIWNLIAPVAGYLLMIAMWRIP